jgi:4-amino-4-deoxy-L-arabinose transferase-like glycosyltransferase
MDKKVFTFLHNCIFIIFFMVILLIFGLNVFFSRGFHSTELPTPSTFNIITFFIAIVLLIIFYKIHSYILEKILKIPTSFLVTILMLTSLSLQLITVHFLSVNPSWDFGEVVRNSRVLLQGGELNDYFIKYPNNIFLVCLLAIVGKVFTSSLITYQLFNIFVILISQYLIYRIANKIGGKLVGLLCLLISVFFFPYIFFAPIVYTDTISLLFLLIPLNLLIRNNGSFRDNALLVITSSIIFSLGMLLKGSLIIFLIAFSLVILLHFNKWKKLMFIVPFLIMFLIINCFNFFIYENGVITQQKIEKYSFPVTHWLMMGQNKERFGKYAAEDVVMTDNLLKNISRDEVIQIHLTELRYRIIEKGWKGNLTYNIEKLAHTWTDGTYYSLNKLKRTPYHPENYKRLIDSNSGYLLQSIARIEHLIILIGIILFAIKVKNRNEFFTFSILSIIGFFFFFILWEARSRYLVSLTPLLIMTSSLGYSVFLKTGLPRRENYTVRKEELNV